MDYKHYYQIQKCYDKRQMGMDLISDNFLANDIARAIIGVVHAYNFYEKLAELAPNEQSRQVILSIQQDKARHYYMFTMILSILGGEQRQIPMGELPMEFEDGVRTAISNELQPASFYQYIATRAMDNSIQMNFMNASNDEQRHVSLLQDILMSINLEGVNSINNKEGQEYKEYVLKLINEFIKVQDEYPLIFSIETKYLDNNREAIQLRNGVINSFEYSEDRVPEKYKDIHEELLRILSSYRESYEKLYIAIVIGDSRAVGENVGRLYQLDIDLNKVINDLSM